MSNAEWWLDVFASISTAACWSLVYSACDALPLRILSCVFIVIASLLTVVLVFARKNLVA